MKNARRRMHFNQGLIWENNSNILSQWFAAFLMLWTFNIVLHVMVIPKHKIIFIAPLNCSFATVVNHNLCFLMVSGDPLKGPFSLQRGHDPHGENLCSKQSNRKRNTATSVNPQIVFGVSERKSSVIFHKCAMCPFPF